MLSSLQLGGYATLTSNNAITLPSVDNRDQKNFNKGQTFDGLDESSKHSQEIKINRNSTQNNQQEKVENSNPG